MKYKIKFALNVYVYCFLMLLLPTVLLAQRDYTALVNPFIGTGAHGHTYPGASMPFGMMQLSPDTRMANWDGSSGYHYSDSVIYGFSHTHLSGTGIPDYCDLLFMPFTGETNWDKEFYKSSFSHENEKASPGYYEVMLDKHKIKAQLAVSKRSGMHQYNFPEPVTQAKLLIDLEHRDPLIDVFIEKINDHEVRGYRRSRSWAQDQVVFFHIISKEVFETEEFKGTINNKEVVTKMALSFGVPKGGQVKFKVGISGVSMEGAKLNLDEEIPGWDFDNLRNQAKDEWNKELGKIDVKGGTQDQQVIFYTALYHTFLAPNLFQDVDGNFRGTDLQIHQGNKKLKNYSVFSLWDTYRAFHPLMTIINQNRTREWLNTFLMQYKKGGMLPVWELSGNETFCMIGYHSVPVILDAYKKGIIKGQEPEFLKAMLSYAESNRFGLDHYRKYGYLSNDREHESVSKTLEYAYDDWCIAEFARLILDNYNAIKRGDEMAGREELEEIIKRYMKRSQNWKNIFDPSTHFMRGKIGSIWYHPFDAREINNFFTEGNSWQYSFAVPHDIAGLIDYHGNKNAFATRLNQLFTASSETTGRDQADVTGLIGQYAHGNEPSHHMAYLFNYAGMPWRTQELVHRICNEFYKNAPGGLIGNEDCGQMSAWYVFSAMGFYPVNPASGEYVIGTPLFDEVDIHLENGKTFTIKAKRQTLVSRYIHSLQLNNEEHLNSFISHSNINNGGVLDFNLQDTPNMEWASMEKNYPNSKTVKTITPVPYFDLVSYKFKNQKEIEIKNAEPGVKIFYSIQGKNNSPIIQYNGPFTIEESCVVESFAVNGKDSSYTIQQYFHKIPNDYSVRVLSNVHSMYTAGGPEALVDGIEGSSNWRTGEWQSYFDQDFEAIVDLKQEKDISFIGIHVLQDVSPWILYPSEVIIYSSDDGIEFKEAGRIKNKISNKSKEVQTQVLGIGLKINTRFIKVKALSGGSLPGWHESAGNPSHLFIDEIIVK